MMELELSQVRPNPRQPRKSFEREAIDALAESIKHDGVVQPIIVRDGGEGYEIVAGERRWRAAKLAGLRTIPALVRPVDDRDSLILALAENVAREDLNAGRPGPGLRRLSTSLISARPRSRGGWARAARPSPTRCGCSSCPTGLDCLGGQASRRGTAARFCRCTARTNASRWPAGGEPRLSVRDSRSRPAGSPPDRSVGPRRPPRSPSGSTRSSPTWRSTPRGSRCT